MTPNNNIISVKKKKCLKSLNAYLFLFFFLSLFTLKHLTNKVSKESCKIVPNTYVLRMGDKNLYFFLFFFFCGLFSGFVTFSYYPLYLSQT